MTNYVRVNDGADYGKFAGKLGPIVQGIDGLVMLIDVRDLDGNDFDITGATAIEARMENTYTGAVTAVDGALAVSGGGLSWTFSTNDSGTAGQFSVLFQFTLSGVIYKGIAALIVEADMAATEAAGEALVRIPADDAAWVAGSEANIAAGTAGNLVDIGADTHLEDSGIAAANVLVDADIGTTVQPHDTGLDDLAGLAVTDGNIPVGDGNNWVAESGATARASLGALPAIADIVEVTTGRDIAASDGGKLLEATATAALNCPDGLAAGLQCAIISIGGTTTITADTTLQYLDGGAQTAGSGVTVNTQCTLIHRGSNVWLALGDVEAI